MASPSAHWPTARSHPLLAVGLLSSNFPGLDLVLTPLLALLLGVPLLATLAGFLPWGSLAALLALAGVLGALAGRSPRRRAPPALAGTAPLDSGPRLAWTSEARHAVTAVRALAKNDCHVDAWLRFARAPLFDGSRATDARWGPAGSRNFTTLDYAALAGSPCPSPVPGWGYPRADLLGRADRS